jgi:hypothetical protein
MDEHLDADESKILPHLGLVVDQGVPELPVVVGHHSLEKPDDHRRVWRYG